MYRKIDDLGRIVIPKEYRKQLGINSNDELNIKLEDNSLILTKRIFEREKIEEEILRLQEMLNNLSK